MKLWTVEAEEVVEKIAWETVEEAWTVELDISLVERTISETIVELDSSVGLIVEIAT